MRDTILVVEDDSNDQYFIRDALGHMSPPVDVYAVSQAEEAQAYLLRLGRFSDHNRFLLPVLIFLDIKMHGMSGFDFLKWLKYRDVLKRIPVVIISSSTLQRDIDQSYELGASAYVVKPFGTERFRKLFRITGEFYLEHAQKPSLQ